MVKIISQSAPLFDNEEETVVWDSANTPDCCNCKSYKRGGREEAIGVRKAELHVSIEKALNKKNRKYAFKRIKNVDDETWERMKKSGPRPPELDRRELYCCIVCVNAFYGGQRIQKEKHQWEAEGALTLGQ